MRDATLSTMILGLILASFLGLAACGGGDEAESRAESTGSEDAAESNSESQGDAAGHATVQTAAEVSHPVVLAQGEEIQITEYLDAGKITVIDFYSDYCPPCKRIEPYLLKLHYDREDITVVKVDINRPGVRGIDWGSPVAKQYRLKSIPHFQIYDPDGRLLAEGRAAMDLLQGYMDGKS